MGSKGSVRKMIQSLKEIVNCSDSEIYTMLVECHMDPNETVIRLISQDAFQEVKSKRNKNKDTKYQAESSRRGIPNRGARNSAKSSYNTARGGGNKFNSNETRLAQRGKGARNHWAGSSSAPKSDPKNAEVQEAAPAGSTGAAASSSSLPPPAYQSAWAKANPGKKTMAEIVKMGKPLHQKKVSVPRSLETQERGSKAPLKDEGSSTEKQERGSKAPLKDEGSSLEKQERGSKAPLKDEGSSTEKQERGSKAPLKDEGSSLEKQERGSKAPLKDEGSSFGKQERGSKAPLKDEGSSLEKQKRGSKAPLKDKGSSTEKQERGSKAPLKDEGSSLEKQESGSKAPLKDEGSSFGKQESGSKAPLKDEGSSFEKQDVSDPVPSLLKPFSVPKTHADQVAFHQHVDESQMDDEVLETKTNQVAFHPDLDQVAQLSHLRFGSFGLIGSGRASSRFNYNLEDTQETEEDSSFRQQDTNFYGGEEELRYNATDEQTSYQIDSTARNYHASSDSEREAAHHEEPPQEDPYMQNLDSFFTNVMDLRDESISPPGGGQQAAALYQHPALYPYFNQHGMPLGYHGNFISDPFMPHGYMHPGFQQGFPVGNHQAPLVVVIPPSASSLQQQQNENTFAWQRPHMRVAPSGEVYIYSVNPNMQPPGFVQAQQLHQQQLSQQALMSLDQLRHQHQYQHHQQSAGEASSQTQEQLWPNNS
ncbi:hypothetical protein IGI04_030988 [Brassica rapa subsp. trilocularis]|uniref:GBF-interacting protein 1 N-terminal domain-containing protein n=1 Tax=Brassica rapa subsp. trilocularis TaxID=1813537 RepID=A0ABQ7LSA3_BRACM|nr:hypothetical protein IGI04_030988 [Brassica rapa subsp. trilocularis]